MKIAQVSNYEKESANGVHKTVVGLVSGLPEYGMEAEVWHFTTTTSRIRERNVDGVCVVDLPAYERPWGYLFGLTPAARAFLKERQRTVKLVHFHSVFIAHNVWLTSMLHLPYVLTPHGGYGGRVLRGRNRFGKTVWMHLREKSYVERASFVHASSLPEQDELRQLFPNTRVVCIPNGVRLPGVCDHVKASANGLRKDLLFLGRLAVDHKGLDRLLRGYARFVEQTGNQDTRLILAGPDFRGGKEKLRQLADVLKISERIAFREAVFGAEKETLLRSAYAFVHLSRSEGMPHAVLEALAVGCPVLLTPETNLGEIVRTHQAGVIVEGRPEEVARGLQALFSMTPEHYVSMRQMARRLVEQQFTWPKLVGRLAEVYCDAVDGRIDDRSKVHRDWAQEDAG